MSARIVLATWGTHGDLNPYLGLALALKGRGHEPVLATIEAYRAVVEGAGVAFRAMGPHVDPDDAEVVSRVMDPRKGSERLFRELLLPALRDSYDELLAATEDADLLLGHPAAIAAPLVGEVRRMRWAAGVLAPISFFSVHDLPVFAPSPAAAQLRRVPGLPRLLVAIIRRVTASWTAPHAALRAELGLAPGGSPMLDGQFSPRLNLAMFSRVLARPQADWPPCTVVTGSVMHDRTSGAALEPALARFLDAGPVPLVFTLGTSAVGTPFARGFFEASAEAAARLGRRAVLVVGRRAESRPAVPSGDGVHVVAAAPFSLLFPRAAAIVHQGGAGTLAQALAAGRPQLVVPHAHDQPDNAHRAARVGVARVLYPRSYGVRRAVRELGALLDDPRVAARAESVGAEVRAEDGAAAACAALEGLLRAGAAGGRRG
jgi:UDP:flavonoid glycosyltransferase YjiC (YdhE family)